MLLSKKLYSLILCGLLNLSLLHAQVMIRPLTGVQDNKRVHELQELDTLMLPFWDDFSTSEKMPDPLLWFSGDVVRISQGQSIQPPSVNAAAFDGLNALGNPYSTDPEAEGKADSLVSHCIDLSVLGADQNDSVFFSFWVQLKGNVEQPDPDDSLTLAFRDVAGEWQTQWSAEGSNIGTKFDSVLIQVDPLFFHDGFQFRFVSYGSLSGPFDAWHIDYVYLNDGRITDDYGIPDRTITRHPSRLFNNYSAVPLDHFLRDSLSTIRSQTQFFNHDNQQVTGFNFQAAVWTEHLGQKITLDSIRPNGAFGGQVPFPFNRRLLIANQPLDASTIVDFLDTTDLTSVTLNTTFAISGTGDLPDFDGSINFLVNDTVTTRTELSDYYAYDDGEAEFEFGVVGAGTQLAHQFYVKELSELTGIDIAFTTGDLSEIELRVWGSIENGAEEVLITKNDEVEDNNGEFVRYTMPSVFVSDTFYIGYVQGVDGFIFMGLDRDNENNDKIFFNGEGIWEQDLVNISGSLLLRPVFGDSSLVTGIEEPLLADQIKIYPNPADHQLNIEGSFDEATLFDIFGRPVRSLGTHRRRTALLETGGLKPGLYILRVRKNKQSINQKIIIRH